MKLRIIVEVVDPKTRKGTRRRREVEIPARVLAVHNALCESRRDLRAFVADDVMSAAIGAVSSQQSATEALSEALLTEPSSRSQHQPQPVQVSAPHGAPPRRQLNKVESFLGLDVIEHMDGIESHSKNVQRAQEAQAAAMAAAAGVAVPEAPKMDWGPVGWGPDKGR